MADTIIAIATPKGRSAIGVLRLSGDKAISLAERFFYSPSRKSLGQVKSGTAVYGFIKDGSGRVVDEVIVTVFRAPFSYTREDMVEISCHGNTILLERVLNLFIEAGARLAERGEFTMRALLNGRIDLTQAQAIISLINANSYSALEIATCQIMGSLSRRIEKMKDRIVEVLMRLEADINFPEEEDVISRISFDEIKISLDQLKVEIEALVSSAELFSVLENGVKIQIVGYPNVGKSSLFNSLLGKERAIVHDLKGTTRDVLCEPMVMDDINIILIDSAGVISDVRGVDELAVEKAKEMLSEAWGVIIVLEAGRPLVREEKDLISSLKNKPSIIFVNKCDVACSTPVEEDLGNYDLPIVKGSAKTGLGLELLKQKMKEVFLSPFCEQKDDIFILRSYQIQQLNEAKKAILLALESFEAGDYVEVIAEHLRLALDCFGKILGQDLDEDLLSAIFSEFCIGK